MRPSVRIFLGFLLFAPLVSCGDGTTAPDTPRATSIVLSRSTLSFTFLGQMATLTATVRDQHDDVFGGTVVWSSSDDSVVTVSQAGRVTAVGNGSAIIQAAAGSVTASVTVTVQQVATRVSVVSGDGQSGTVGERLSAPLVVRSEDQGGAPVPSTEVTFTVARGGGSVSRASVVSDGEAVASTDWTLGTVAGTQEVAAAVAGTGTGSAVLTAQASAGPPAALEAASGNDQSGTVGVLLPDPVVVRVADAFGNGVAGRAVVFSVTGGGGSVSPTQATTGEDGTASAAWTMGSLGSNTLRATSEGLPPVDFTAEATPARADLQPGTPETDPQNPTSVEGLDVTTRVANVGHLSTGTGFRVQLLVDGAEVGSADVPALEAGASAAATFTLDPLDGGSHTFRVVADVDGVVEESDEENNEAQSIRSVATAQRIVPGTPVAGIGAQEGTEYHYVLEVPASEPGTMTVELSGGAGDVDLYVHYGRRPARRDDYECQSGNPDTTERCVFNAAEPGTYHVLLYAWADYSGATMLATTGGPVVPFDIEVVILDHGTSAQDAAFQEAADRWMDIITSDIPSQSFAFQPVEANACTQGQPRIDDEVDDIRIYVRIDSIDGPSGTLAQAGPCILRGLKAHPVIGVMTFDEADLEALSAVGAMVPVILHEMGHVLGLGTIWSELGLLENPSIPSNPGVDTYFPGERAIDAFDEAGGTTVYTLGEKVPVENLAGPGSSDAHWRESVLGPELMTPSYNGGRANPLSGITIASMADLGYRVDMSRAEPFTRSYRTPGRETAERPSIDLGDDVRTGPVLVVDGKGRVLRVMRR